MLPFLLSLAAVAAFVLFFPLKARIRFNFSGKACEFSFKFWKFERSFRHEFSASDLKTSFVKPSSEEALEKERKKAAKLREKAAVKKRKEEAKRAKAPKSFAETASYKRTETENLTAEVAPAEPQTLSETASQTANIDTRNSTETATPTAELSPQTLSETASPTANIDTQNSTETATPTAELSPQNSPETDAQNAAKIEAPTAGIQAQALPETETQAAETDASTSAEKVAPRPEAARIPHENDARRVPPPGEPQSKKKQAEEFSERDFLTIWLQQESVSLLWRLGIRAFNRAFHLLGAKFEDSYIEGLRASSFERTGYLAALAGGLRAVFPALEGWNVSLNWSGCVPFAVFGRCTLQTNLFRVLGLGLFALYMAARLVLHYYLTKRKYRKNPGSFELSWFRGKVVSFLSE